MFFTIPTHTPQSVLIFIYDSESHHEALFRFPYTIFVRREHFELLFNYPYPTIKNGSIKPIHRKQFKIYIYLIIDYERDNPPCS